MPPSDPPHGLANRLRFAAGALRRTVSAWVVTVWTGAGLAWNVLGRYDLALSQLMSPETAAKFPRAYQGLVMLSAWLSSWVFWTIGGLMIAFCAAVEWGVRAEMRGERNAEAKRKAIPRSAYPPDAPISVIAAKAERFVDALAKGLTESPKPRPSPVPLPPDPEPEPDWSRIFGLTDTGEFRLLVIPDQGDDIAGHTLLLALYGYRILKSYARVSVQQAASEAIRAMRDAPNAPLMARALLILSTMQALEPEKFGLGVIQRGEAERIALRAGGAYELTQLGLERADDLARDLIRRA